MKLRDFFTTIQKQEHKIKQKAYKAEKENTAVLP